jgi:hypothetical protein
VSGNRPNAPPWLADHVIYFAYRWVSWAAVALWLVLAGRLTSGLALMLLATAVLNLPATAYAQRYIRVVRRNPALLVLDMLLMIVVLVLSGGWSSAFVPHAFASLVLPALLFGWRGGVMAGLTFVTLDQSALWATGTPASVQLADGSWVVAELALRMGLPPLFGGLFAPLADLLRARLARGAGGRGARQIPPPDSRVSRGVRPETSRYGASSRFPGEDDGPLGKSAFAAQAIRTRTTERSVEDLRRVVFAPLPSPDMDLAAAVDLLVMRFGQHTGSATRVALMGRTRLVHRVQRDLLIRLAQEALLNIQQHAQAASAMVTLRYDSTSVALLIQDDGVGLLDGTYERPGLHALRAMHYRLAECGGRLDVFETEGGGVTVRATVPLE